MELKLVTGQSFTSLQQAYHDYAPEFVKGEHYEAGWIKLIQHLEQCEGPPQWVMASKHRLFIMEVDAQKISRAKIQISSWCHSYSSSSRFSELYEICYRVPDDEVPWESRDDNIMGTWMRGTAHSVEAAGRMIVIALERAATNLIHTLERNAFPS